MDWIALYKFGRLALLALLLVGIAIAVYRPSRREHFEAPGRRILEEDGGE